MINVGDTSTVITVRLTSDGAPINSTAASCSLRFMKPSGALLTKAADTFDSQGVATYVFKTGECNEPEQWQLQPTVSYLSGATQPFPIRTFPVGRSL